MAIPANAAALPQRVHLGLLKIIRDNIATQYASQAVSLANFRDGIANHGPGGIEDDTTLLANFRALVPLSTYESYKPFLDKFGVQPCKEEDVLNMFSPGLPDFFAVSSGTSGMNPKILPKYNHNARLNIPPRRYFDMTSKEPLAVLVCTVYRDIKVVERAPGDVTQIPVCLVSGGFLRRSTGWYIDDENRMSFPFPAFVVPWAATTIAYFPSFLVIHGLFFLANRDVHRFQIPFTTQFMDLIRHIDNHWEVLMSCIKDGSIPDLEGIDHVRHHLQASLHPNPERAAELIEIGRPLSSGGWFARVWPKTTIFYTICSGPFAIALPKMRSILGSSIPIRCPGYASSEVAVGTPYDPNKYDEFVLAVDDIVEFLDISVEATHENVCQAWEVEVGKQYEPIVTTRDGLWRYRLGDIVHIIGFDNVRKSPVFKYAGRRALTLRFPFMQVTDDQLLAAIEAFSSDDMVRVQEFTTMMDDRALLPTVGFFVELTEPLGPNAHLASQKLFDALVTTNVEYRLALENGKMRLPTIRVLKPATFAEYRQWKGEKGNIAFGRVKVPLLLLDPTAREWISEKVVQEL